MKSVAANNTAVENNHPTLLTNTKSSKKKRKNRTKGESQRTAPNNLLETVEKCNTASTVLAYNKHDSNDGIDSLNKTLEHNLHISKNGCRIDLVDDLKSKKYSKLTNNDNEHKKKNVDSAINGEGGAKRKSNKSLELIQTNGNITDFYHSRHSDAKPNLGLCENEEVTTVDRDNIYCHQITTVDSFETNSKKTLNKSTDDSSLAILESPLPLPSSDVQATVAIDNNLIDSKNIVIDYKVYESELQMPDIMRLIQAELSEPYSIYTYRYFIYNWPKLCFLAAHGDEYVGAIVCKLDMHRSVKRGYIAMLAVKQEYRKLKIGTTLVEKAVEAMLEDNAEEVVLETERKNIPALRLYENLGFVRDKRLFRYYLNGVDALRLKLWFR